MKEVIASAIYTNVIYKTGQCLRNHTVVNADRYKCFVQSGEAKIGLLHLSNRYYILSKSSSLYFMSIGIDKNFLLIAVLSLDIHRNSPNCGTNDKIIHDIYHVPVNEITPRCIH